MLVSYDQLNDQSRALIYQSNSLLTTNVIPQIMAELNRFLENWTAHDLKLKTYGNILYRRFIVIFIDESFAAASGCSLDKATHFIQYLEDKYQISLLERMDVAYIHAPLETEELDEAIHIEHLQQLKILQEKGIIEKDTLVFNNLVSTKAEFESRWKIAVGQSWHARFLS